MTVKLQNEMERIAQAHEDDTPDVVGHAIDTNETSRLAQRVAQRLSQRGEDAVGEDGEGRIAL
jgi:hypothetical protein